MQHFTLTDWLVIFGYLLLTTWVGHRMRGKQGTIKDFFAGGRSLPWWAVCGSIIATEISGVTFIGVPGGVMAAQGNFTYMLWGIGSILGRVVVGTLFVKTFYEDEIYSPYDYMGRRIKPQLKNLATAIFTLGAILGQSVRVLVAALPLRVVSDLPFEWCILLIGLFAIGWTLMGGMRTVIWTDVMQFFLFTFGGLLTLFWIVTHLPGGWGEFWSVSSAAGKTQMWDTRFGLGPEFEFTFWVAIFAVPFQNLTAFGVDQLNAQRMFCCRNAHEAGKAIIFSSVGQALTYLMLLVGAALYVYYQRFPADEAVAAALHLSPEGIPKDGDLVFPVWIATELPVGLRGLIIAGLFAACISSLDSILAALSQTTVSVLHSTEGSDLSDEAHQQKLVQSSRRWVIIWGLFLTAFTFVLLLIKERLQIAILPLAFGMTSYTMGPLLGMFTAALLGRGSYRGLLWGTLASLLLVTFVRLDLWVLLSSLGVDISFLAHLPTYTLQDGSLSSTVGYFWMWPLTAMLTLGGGLLIPPARSTK